MSKYEKYWDALDGVGPKIKELILERAAHDSEIDLDELVSLARWAHPEEA